MMNPKREWKSIGMCAATIAVASVVLIGCSKAEEDVVAVAPPPPPPPQAPPPPALTPIDQLMVQLNIDPRVRLPEAKAPDNDEDRKAVLVFFDAFARGDANAVKGMLPETDQHEMTPLVDSGVWKKSVAEIKSIDVQTGRNGGNKCALAVIETGKGAVSNFQPQLWYYTSESSSAVFEAAATPPGIIDQLSGNDWIAAWHKILADELALADKPEEEFEPAKKILDDGDKTSSSGNPGLGGKGGQRGLGRQAPTIPAPGLPGGGERGR